MTSLIGVSGKLQSGKDTVAKIINYLITGGQSTYESLEGFLEYYDDGIGQYPFEVRKFADKLKDMVCLLLGCTREQLEDPKFKKTPLGEEWVKYELSYTSYDRLSYCNCPDYYKKYFCSKEEALEYIKGNLEVDRDSISISKIELTPRLLLQLLGTECGRNIIHPNIWVNATFANFADKEEWFRKETGLTRTEYIIKNGHSSEYKTLNEQFFKSLPKWIITDVRFPNEAKAIKDRKGITIRINREIKHQVEALGGRTDVPEGYFPTNQHESETALDDYEFDYMIDNNGTIENLIEKVRQILITEGLLIK